MWSATNPFVANTRLRAYATIGIVALQNYSRERVFNSK